MNNRLLVTLSLLFATFFSVSANPTDTLYQSEIACDSIFLFGTEYYSDTVVMHLETHEEGRDTFYILTLHFNFSVHTNLYDTACISYEYQGQTYTLSGDYEVGRYPASNGCDSVVTLHLTIIPPLPMHAITGDTLVCHGQRATFSYPIGDDFDRYWYLWYFVPEQPMGTNQSSIVWNVGDESLSTVTVGMRIVDSEHHCIIADTTLVVHVCEESSPDRAQVLRKSNSNILVCSDIEDPAGIVHYRWGLTDKQTYEENADDAWDFNYYQYNTIDTVSFQYWVETCLFHGDVVCRNRSYFGEETATGIDQHQSFHIIACMRDDKLLLQVDNPAAEQLTATLYDIAGRTVAQWILGSEPVIRRQFPFTYPGGAYLLSVQSGEKRHTTKILRAL